MKTIYQIEILCEPENGEYFWCILANSGNNWYNSGMCGWDKTIDRAAQTACEKYKFFMKINLQQNKDFINFKEYDYELKSCPNCGKEVMSYNSYFNAYICQNCGYEE